MINYRREQLIAEEIEKDIDNLIVKMEALVEDIDYEGATTEPLSFLGKQMKQLKTIQNRAKKIHKYMNDLILWNNNSEELEEEKNSVDYKFRKLSEDKKKRIARISACLMHTNVLDIVTIHQYNIVKEDIEIFCDMFNIEYASDGHGDWLWIYFTKDGKRLDIDDLRAIGATYSEDDFNDNEEENRIQKESDEEFVQEELVEETLSYGWLAPNGDFVESGWGTHEESAIAIIKEKNWKKEYDDTRMTSDDLILARDFLVFNKGYALIHNPIGIGFTKVQEPKRLTKKQREFLFDYFTKEGNSRLASYYLEEE